MESLSLIIIALCDFMQMCTHDHVFTFCLHTSLVYLQQENKPGQVASCSAISSAEKEESPVSVEVRLHKSANALAAVKRGPQSRKCIALELTVIRTIRDF